MPRRRDAWLPLLLSLPPTLGCLEAAHPQSMVFTHVATAANSTGAATLIEPQPPSTFVGENVFVTQDWNPPGSAGVYNDHPIGLSRATFGGGPLAWAIVNMDGAAIPAGAAFTIWIGRWPAVTPDPANTSFMHVTTAGNTAGAYSTTDHPALNGNPGAAPVFTTRVWTANPAVEVLLYYNAISNRWVFVPTDSSPMPVGAAFHVCIGNCGLRLPAGADDHVCTAEAVAGNVCYLDPALGRAHRILATNTGPYLGTGPIGTWWDDFSGRQAVFLQDFTETMPTGETFDLRWSGGMLESGFETGDLWGWTASP